MFAYVGTPSVDRDLHDGQPAIRGDLRRDANNLYRRATDHRLGRVPGFTKTHGCGLLVWCQPFELVVTALRREKALKRWNRAWKMQLIERRNPDWADLYPWLCEGAPDPRLPDEDDGGVAAFLARREAGLED